MCIRKYIVLWGKITRGCLFFLLPSFLITFFLKLFNIIPWRDEGVKIGFSFVCVEHLDLYSGCKIGHFNLIILPVLNMQKGSCIKHLNFIKGNFTVLLREKALIRMKNKISGPMKTDSNIEFILGKRSSIQVGHLFDVTANIIIGDQTLFAGVGTQVWTHSFYLEKQGDGCHRIDGDIIIGNKVNISSRCIICCGISIKDNIMIGANTCISRSLDMSGLYVNQSLRFIEFDSDKKMSSMNPVRIEGDYRFYKKQ